MNLLNMSFLSSVNELWNHGTYWNEIFQVMLICALLLLAQGVRRRIPFLRNMLIPTSVIAGLLGLGLKVLFNQTGMNIQGLPLIDGEFMNVITYHTLAVGFIAIGFVSSQKKRVKDGSAIKSGLLIASTYTLQGIVGVAATIVLAAIFSGIGSGFAISNAPYAGIILPLAFGQGPGQAGNFGTTYQALSGEFAQYALAGGRDFGLTLAAIGTLVAVVFGTIFLNIFAAKGHVVREKDAETKVIVEAANPVDVEGEIAATESTDKLAVQIAIVGLTYLVTFLLMFALTELFVTVLGVVFLRPLLWGFNFLFALLVTVLVKTIYNRMRARKVIKRGYINNYLMSRISGTAFDFMIVTAIVSIELENIAEPSIMATLIVLSIIGTIITFFYVYYVTKKHFKSRFIYSFVTFFGNLTGTASNGLALLREIDPELKSGASDDLIEGSTTAIAFGAPILAVLSFVYQGTFGLYLSLGLMVVYFILTFGGLVIFSRHKDKQLAKPLKGGGGKD